MIVLTGSANPGLAGEVARQLGVPLAACLLERFPDGELHAEVRESVRGRNVFIVQPTSPPVEAHVFELVLLADACRRAGARQRIGVLPYFGYGRQDRRAGGRESIGARVVADLLATAGLDLVVVLDLHSRAVEGFFSMPAEHLSAVSLLADAMKPAIGSDAVLVAPDLGAVKLASRYSRLLGASVATVHKTRLSGREVQVQKVVGDVRGRRPVVVDDMITTGGTVAAAVRALLAEGCAPDVTVVATHGVFAERAAHVLRDLPVGRIVTTDSVAPREEPGLLVDVVSVAPLLADVMRRLDAGHSLAELESHE